MNVLIVYAHAEPKSFNGTLFQTAQQALRAGGHTVVTSDLYAMKFDPVSDRRNFTTVKNPDFFKQQIEEMHATEVGGFAPDLEAELRKMEACDLMIWQFPLWWFGLPGILKGWADRVFAMGRTYGGERFYESGVFKGKRALLSVTTGGPEAVYQGRVEWRHSRDPASHPARDSAVHGLGRARAEHRLCAGPRFRRRTAGAPERLGGAIARH